MAAQVRRTPAPITRDTEHSPLTMPRLALQARRSEALLAATGEGTTSLLLGFGCELIADAIRQLGGQVGALLRMNPTLCPRRG